MKKFKLHLAVILLVIITSIYGQKPTIELTFTADNNGQHVPLNSILIENLTQGGDTTLYAPDTVLVLNYILGMNENFAFDDNSFSLSQNYPNPMIDKTTIGLHLPESEHILVTVSDIMGRELIHQEYVLARGSHSFTFYPGRESLYFLSALANQQSQTIKMFNSPSNFHGSGICKLEYNGTQAGFDNYKSGNNLNNFIFSLSDQIRYKASTALGERTINDSPTGDLTYTFQYASGIPCPGIPTITDIDGNVYNTVLIGNQCWMKENLKTTTYQNGTAIPNVTDNYAWDILTTGAYVWWGNNISWKDKYGALYNWFTTVDTNGLCPTGWHVPTDDEWTALTDFIGGDGEPHGNELKSCRQVNSPLGGGCDTTQHPRWNEHNTHYGTDDYGFSGLPSGDRGYDGIFSTIGYDGYWWSSTEYFTSDARFRSLFYDYGGVSENYGNKPYGFSVRCLRDSENPLIPVSGFSGIPTIGIAPLTVNFTDQSTNNPASWQWDFGDGGTSSQQNPVHTYNAIGTYTVQLTVSNSFGYDTEIKTNYINVNPGSMPCPGTPIVTDIDGNTYNTVQIGNQCWMKENLKTTTYQNGTAIPNVTDNYAWDILTTGAYVWYDNDISWKDSYGALYNWLATVDTNGLCPTGWHVPTDDEWTALTDFIGGDGEPHGNELKSCRQVNSPLGGGCDTTQHPRWNEHNTHYGTDDYGFSGLPGGSRHFAGSFVTIGDYGLWWSSTENSYWFAELRCLGYGNGYVNVDPYYKDEGFSVRCIRD